MLLQPPELAPRRPSRKIGRLLVGFAPALCVEFDISLPLGLRVRDKELSHTIDKEFIPVREEELRWQGTLRRRSIGVVIRVERDCTTLSAYAMAYCHHTLAPPGSVGRGIGWIGSSKRCSSHRP